MVKGGNILIIDDEEDLRENLKYVLQMEGYTVELAEDGVEGLQKLDTFKPDLIVLDLNMPNMGGIEFYQKICEGDVPRYPVFVLTARANMEQFFKDFNVDGFMSKPFEIPELINEINIVITKHFKISAVGKEKNYKNVFIVENDESFSVRAGSAFLMRGLTVNLAKTGTEAIERITKDVPDVVFVNINLKDIPGELVIMKLKRMAKTSGITKVLYAHDVGDKIEVSKKIRDKEGIDKFIAAASENDLLNVINEL